MLAGSSMRDVNRAVNEVFSGPRKVSEKCERQFLVILIFGQKMKMAMSSESQCHQKEKLSDLSRE